LATAKCAGDSHRNPAQSLIPLCYVSSIGAMAAIKKALRNPRHHPTMQEDAAVIVLQAFWGFLRRTIIK